MMLPVEELGNVFIRDLVLGDKPLDALLFLLGVLGGRLDLEEELVEVLLVLSNTFVYVKMCLV